MKSFRFPLFLSLGLLMLTLTGCDAIGTIFKAGAYSAIIGIFLVAVLIFWLVSKMRGPRT